MKPIDNNLISAALLLNRLTLGMLFVFAGVRKLIPLDAMTENWNGFASLTASKAPLPEALGKAYGYALPPVEILAGTALVLGLFSRVSAILIALMLLSFVIAMGPEWWPDSGPAFSKNFILITLALKPDGPLK